MTHEQLHIAGIDYDCSSTVVIMEFLQVSCKEVLFPDKGHALGHANNQVELIIMLSMTELICKCPSRVSYVLLYVYHNVLFRFCQEMNIHSDGHSLGTFLCLGR